jgi:hypothetical protein
MLELFSSTLSADPNVRKLAEIRLREVQGTPYFDRRNTDRDMIQAERQPGFLVNVLELIKTHEEPAIQQAGMSSLPLSLIPQPQYTSRTV